MSKKFYFLLLGTLLLVQCVLSDSSEEASKDESKDSSEEKIDEDHLKRHVTKFYIKLLDQTVAATKEFFETVINDVQNKKATTNRLVPELLDELEKVLKKASTKTTTTNVDDERRKKNHILNDIFDITKDLKKIEDKATTHTELDETVRKAHETLIKGLNKNIETFADRTVQEIEKLWKGLSTTEQKEKQSLHDALTELKNEPTAPKKLRILDKVFVLSDDTVTNAVAS